MSPGAGADMVSRITIGDINTIIESANKVHDRLIDAPAEFKALSDECVSPSSHS